MNQYLIDYYRIPTPLCNDAAEDTNNSERDDSAHNETNKPTVRTGDRDASFLAGFRLSPAVPELPPDFTLAIDALRRERYGRSKIVGRERLATSGFVRRLYYFVRSYLPDSARTVLQRAYFSNWRDLQFPAWPIDVTVDALHEQLLRQFIERNGIDRIPFIWFWPDGAPSCLILTHDIETHAGRDFTSQLMNLDDAYDFKASFQVIPEKRYHVSDEFIQQIKARGFEINVHDLNHDGQLYRNRSEFLRRAAMINAYARKYNAEGFRAGAMYRNADWYDAFELSYDMSFPNVAHFEPKRGGCCTVMPYFIGNIAELPLTTIQDYALFNILGDYSTALWKQQVAMIHARNGLISFLAHPDYLIEPRARAVYKELLGHLSQMVLRENIWAPLPSEVARWWRARSQMRLVQKGNRWEIEGPQCERARIAYAMVDGDGLHYEIGDFSRCIA